MVLSYGIIILLTDARHIMNVMPDVVVKWGETVAARGFAQVPNHLLQINNFLSEEHRLKPLELLVLIELVGSWWKKNEPPFLSIKTIAFRCGASDRQVHRAIKQLEDVKLLARTKRPRIRGIIASNAYDLSPLVATLKEISEIYLNEHPRILKKPTIEN